MPGRNRHLVVMNLEPRGGRQSSDRRPGRSDAIRGCSRAVRRSSRYAGADRNRGRKRRLPRFTRKNLSISARVSGNIGAISVDSGPQDSIAQPEAGIFLRLDWPNYEG